jgi:predicted transcriptional regulator
MSIKTTDVRSNPKEQIMHAAEEIGRSEVRRKVFEEICRGKRRAKTVEEIASTIGFDKKQVFDEARALYNNRIIERQKIKGKPLAYLKDDFYSQHKAKILKLATNRSARENFPTRWNPRITAVIKLPVARKSINAKHITIDDIDSFGKVAEVQLAPGTENRPILEESFQQGLQKILGEEGEFNDWGGEGDDLFSSRLMFGGKRVTVAFGLKGRGTTGRLTPKKLGKQGDQIQRLFRAPADIFMIQYWDQIDKSVVELMKLIASGKSALEGRRIYYGEIDGQDTLRILQAYSECFDQNIHQDTYTQRIAHACPNGQK